MIRYGSLAFNYVITEPLLEFHTSKVSLHTILRWMDAPMRGAKSTVEKSQQASLIVRLFFIFLFFKNKSSNYRLS